MDESKLKLVESFSELQSGMRILIKNCRQCKGTCIDLLGKYEINRFVCAKSRQVESGFKCLNPCTDTEEHIHDCKSNMDCITEKRLYRFVDYDPNSDVEKEKTDINNKISNNIKDVVKKLAKV